MCGSNDKDCTVCGSNTNNNENCTISGSDDKDCTKCGLNKLHSGGSNKENNINNKDCGVLMITNTEYV